LSIGLQNRFSELLQFAAQGGKQPVAGRIGHGFRELLLIDF
jgi:hypothetical protein